MKKLILIGLLFGNIFLLAENNIKYTIGTKFKKVENINYKSKENKVFFKNLNEFYIIEKDKFNIITKNTIKNILKDTYSCKKDRKNKIKKIEKEYRIKVEDSKKYYLHNSKLIYLNIECKGIIIKNSSKVILNTEISELREGDIYIKEVNKIIRKKEEEKEKRTKIIFNKNNKFKLSESEFKLIIPSKTNKDFIKQKKLSKDSIFDEYLVKKDMIKGIKYINKEKACDKYLDFITLEFELHEGRVMIEAIDRMKNNGATEFPYIINNYFNYFPYDLETKKINYVKTENGSIDMYCDKDNNFIYIYRTENQINELFFKQIKEKLRKEIKEPIIKEKKDKSIIKTKRELMYVMNRLENSLEAQKRKENELSKFRKRIGALIDKTNKLYEKNSELNSKVREKENKLFKINQALNEKLRLEESLRKINIEINNIR